MNKDLDDVYVTVNGVSAPVSMYGNAFISLSVFLVFASFPYVLNDMYEQRDLYSQPFRNILVVYNTIISIPLRVPTDYFLDEFDGILCFGLIVVYWFGFYFFLAVLLLFVARRIGRLWTLLLTVGPLVLGLFLFGADLHKRPLHEVRSERAATQAEKNRVREVEKTALDAEIEQEQKERKIWGSTLDSLYIMGYQVVFPPKYKSFVGSAAARGELAVESYAKKNGLVGVDPEKIRSNIAAELYSYLVPIQACLQKHGYFQGKVDGVYGPGTRATVQATSKSIHGLPYSATIGLPNPPYVKRIKEEYPDCMWQ